jgi:hypothetical protein
MPAECSRTRGQSDKPTWPLSRTHPRVLRALCWDTRARESFSQARSARAPPVTGSLRHRVDGPRPRDCSPTGAGAQSKAIPPRKPRIHVSRATPGRRVCGPPYDQLALGARDVLPAVPDDPEGSPGFTGSAGEPGSHRHELVCTRPAIGTPGTAGRSDRSRGLLPGPRARVPRRSAKSGRDRRYPRCFPSIGYQRPQQRACARSASHEAASDLMPSKPAEPVRWLAGAFHSLSPACGEHTAPFSTLPRSGRLDGPPVSESAVSAARWVSRSSPIRAAMVAHPTPADHPP